jgi:hypothetical protein
VVMTTKNPANQMNENLALLTAHRQHGESEAIQTESKNGAPRLETRVPASDDAAKPWWWHWIRRG